MFYNDFTVRFLDRAGFPEEARACFLELEKRLDSDAENGREYGRIIENYMEPWAHDLGARLEELNALSEKLGISNYTLHMAFFINCAETLLERYYERGVDEEIFWRSMDDLRCKLLECRECEGVWGTFVGGWFHRFYDMTRFGLGRFQFEFNTYDDDDRQLSGGFTLKEGQYLIGFHIPSSGIPLTDEVRYDSYKRAYEFYKQAFGGGPVYLQCGSWLLYPDNKKILPENSNVIKFINDFEILASKERDEFGDAWRVFGRYADLPPEQLPRDTAMRRAFADWLASGKKTGDGYGIIVFDGEKILNR